MAFFSFSFFFFSFFLAVMSNNPKSVVMVAEGGSNVVQAASASFIKVRPGEPVPEIKSPPLPQYPVSMYQSGVTNGIQALSVVRIDMTGHTPEAAKYEQAGECLLARGEIRTPIARIRVDDAPAMVEADVVQGDPEDGQHQRFVVQEDDEDDDKRRGA